MSVRVLPKWWAGGQGASQMVGRRAGCFPNGGQASRVLPKWWAGKQGASQMVGRQAGCFPNGGQGASQMVGRVSPILKNVGRVSSILNNEGRSPRNLGRRNTCSCMIKFNP